MTKVIILSLINASGNHVLVMYSQTAAIGRNTESGMASQGVISS